jgi:GTPase SAR1 family protein
MQVRADDVFTPTTPAKLAFVEREKLNEKLVDALQTPGKQVVIYGHSGSGKTTLLVNKLNQLYEKHVTTRCISGLRFDQVCLDAFDQLDGYYASEFTATKTGKVSSSLKAAYLGIQSKIGVEYSDETRTKQMRVIPPQLTPQTLARFLGEAKCCWVLEDFHKVNVEEKVQVSQVMKVFMDMADLYRDLKIIAIGAVDTARQVVQYDLEMRNRVAEIHIPLMNAQEIQCIIEKGEALLNFRLPDPVKLQIVSFSNGMASVCHHLCLNICRAAGIIETPHKRVLISQEHLQRAIEQYIEEASDTLKAAFDRAFRVPRFGQHNRYHQVTRAVASFNQNGATHGEIVLKLRQLNRMYAGSSLMYHSLN